MNALAFVRKGKGGDPRPSVPLSRRGRLIWTTGNLLMLVGLYLLLYVGGLFADEQYNLMAALGDSDLPLPEAVASAPVQPDPVAAATAAPGGGIPPGRRGPHCRAPEVRPTAAQ